VNSSIRPRQRLVQHRLRGHDPVLDGRGCTSGRNFWAVGSSPWAGPDRLFIEAQPVGFSGPPSSINSLLRNRYPFSRIHMNRIGTGEHSAVGLSMGLDKSATGPSLFGWPIKAQPRRPLGYTHIRFRIWPSMLPKHAAQPQLLHLDFP
jgi:hypothetical protein